jgi:hypothetical protein
MRLVGITGRADTGKSLVAGNLASSSGYGIVSFSAPLKQMATRFLIDQCGYSVRDLAFFMSNKTMKMPGLGVTMRHFLQTLGTDWGRNMIHPFIWVNLGEDLISSRLGIFPIVVDDLRFEDEAAVIRDHGGLVIHLRRSSDATDGHISEAGVSVLPNDVVIINDCSVLELMGRVSQAIDRFYVDTNRLLALCHTPWWRYRVRSRDEH